MNTTSEIITKLEAEAFEAEEMARVWGGESQCAPPLRAAAARLAELERENARMRAQFMLLMNRPEIIGASIDGLWEFARAALAGSGEK